MSMNINIKMVSKGMFIPQNEKLDTIAIERTDNFECVQTSTNVTREILNSDNPLKAYKAHIVENFDNDEIMPIYAEDDPWQEGNPIGSEIENYGKNHLEELNEFLALHQNWDMVIYES